MNILFHFLNQPPRRTLKTTESNHPKTTPHSKPEAFTMPLVTYLNKSHDKRLWRQVWSPCIVPDNNSHLVHTNAPISPPWNTMLIWCLPGWWGSHYPSRLTFLCAERTTLVLPLFMQISSHSASLEWKLRIYSFSRVSPSLSPLFGVFLARRPDVIKTILWLSALAEQK